MNPSKTNDEILAELGRRLRERRIAQELRIADVALQSGLSSSVVKAMEGGRDARLTTVVKVLRTLGELDALDAFLPELPPDPVALLASKGAERKRVRRKRER